MITPTTETKKLKFPGFFSKLLDWTKRFTTIAGALDIPGEAIIDGEVVVVHEGRTNFSELQAELAAGRQGRLVYYAFDLLWRNGDLRKRASDRAKAIIARSSRRER